MAANATKEVTYAWEGTDRKGKKIKGEMRATGEAFVNATLRRQGITVLKIKKQGGLKRGGSVSDKDVKNKHNCSLTDYLLQVYRI